MHSPPCAMISIPTRVSASFPFVRNSHLRPSAVSLQWHPAIHRGGRRSLQPRRNRETTKPGKNGRLTGPRAHSQCKKARPPANTRTHARLPRVRRSDTSWQRARARHSDRESGVTLTQAVAAAAQPGAHTGEHTEPGRREGERWGVGRRSELSSHAVGEGSCEI